MCYYVKDKAMKRRVTAEIGFREPRCWEEVLKAAVKMVLELRTEGFWH